MQMQRCLQTCKCVGFFIEIKNKHVFHFVSSSKLMLLRKQHCFVYSLNTKAEKNKKFMKFFSLFHIILAAVQKNFVKINF